MNGVSDLWQNQKTSRTQPNRSAHEHERHLHLARPERIRRELRNGFSIPTRCRHIYTRLTSSKCQPELRVAG